MSLSVLTIVRGRKLHLRNQFQGLLESNTPPVEWIIVGMGETPEIDGGQEFPVRVDSLPLEDDGRLPLAAARNHAAQLAQSDHLLFLDVDCIPAPDLIDGMVETLEQERGLWMGRVGYLPPRATRWGWTFPELESMAVDHPILPKIAAGERCPDADYCHFWSLCFGIHRDDFSETRGFDTSFCGYGAEDTDFSFTCRKKIIPFGMVGYSAYHQHHAVYKPPLNHFDAIIANARRFYEKWNQWPMESWLGAFVERGLIEWNEQGERLTVIRQPTKQEIAGARVDAPAGFSPALPTTACLPELSTSGPTLQADPVGELASV